MCVCDVDGGGKGKRGGEKERERCRWKMAARRKSDTKSKETPSQSAAPPLYHWLLPPRVSSFCLARALQIKTIFPVEARTKKRENRLSIPPPALP